jgi:ribosomal protein S12 methylthiotransferase
MHSSPPQDKGTYALVSLGCAKNLVDSERMAGLLGLRGYRMVAEPDGADFVVVNTCGFIADARDESYSVIREMLRLKGRGRTGGVIVAGCLAQRDQQALLERYPGIDQLVGVFARDQIATAAARIVGTVPASVSTTGDSPIFGPTLPVVARKSGQSPLAQERTLFCPAPERPLEDSGRLRITPRHLAFVKIAEGCSRLCSFCSIPRMRGPYATKPIEQVVAEAEELAADGARELILIAQDTSFYGMELDGRPRLAELLTRLEAIEGLAWIRLMYLYPQHVGDDLIDVLAGGKKVLPYLDLPLQHCNDDILRQMRRGVTAAESRRLIDRLRGRIARLVLRTTLLAGFPGETAQQFDELLQFVRRERFERLGAFAYSAEPGTAAAELDGALPEDVKLTRREQLLAAQQEIAFAWSRSQVGRTLDVLIDRAVPGHPDAFVGRSYADAPEIDGAVYVTGAGLRSGQIVACEIVAARGYDLVGVPSQDADPAARNPSGQPA